MTDQPIRHIGYCTNVHPGANWADVKANLERHALRVKEQVSPDAPLGIGLWLSSDAAREIMENNAIGEMKRWLDESGLKVFTLNGFPYGNFHERTVKHKVYEPDWSTERRFHYTYDLINILGGLMSEGEEASISTLPIGWPSKMAEEQEELTEMLEFAGENLVELARHLENYEGWNNKFIHIDLEPEPGCVLQRSLDVSNYIEQYLIGRGYDSAVKRHIAVCHDICHAAVMFEPQATALNNYAQNEIYVGKVQVSSAIRARFSEMNVSERIQALQQLSEFAEDRYLHQTVVEKMEGGYSCYEDLPEALDDLEPDASDAKEVRVHFHVPLFLDKFGLLETTQSEVVECLQILRETQVRQYEVETYAWNVLPEELQEEELSDGIAHEIEWLNRRLGLET